MSKVACAQELEMKNFEHPSFKRRLFKDVLLGIIVLLCFMAFMNWSTPEVAVVGVIVIALSAWISETSFKFKGFIPLRNKAVVITGCDTGFGHLLAKHLADLGVTVFAGCLNSNGVGAKALRDHGSDQLHVLQMNVTSENEVRECVAYICEKTNGTGVYGVVNNAGVNFVGDVELTTMQQFSMLANVNQLGMVRVTKAFIPDVRKNKGRIVNVTSVKGRVAEPFNAPYAMTKFAGEAFSDVLRMEMRKFGVFVSIIEPGNFGGATGCLDIERIGNDFKTMWANASDEVRSLYGKRYIDHHLRWATDGIPTASFNLAPVLEAMTDALFSTSPHPRYLIPGSCNWYDKYSLKVWLAPFLPSSLMDWWLLGEVSSFPKPVNHKIPRMTGAQQ